MDIVSAVTIAVALIILTAIVTIILWLQRDTNAQYDLPLGEVFYAPSDSKTRVASTTALKGIYRQLKSASKPSESKPLKRRIDHLRAVMDQLRTHIPLASTISPNKCRRCARRVGHCTRCRPQSTITVHTWRRFCRRQPHQP